MKPPESGSGGGTTKEDDAVMGRSEHDAWGHFGLDKLDSSNFNVGCSVRDVPGGSHDARGSTALVLVCPGRGRIRLLHP